MKTRKIALVSAALALSVGTVRADKRLEVWCPATSDSPVQFTSGSIRLDEDAAETSLVLVNAKERPVTVIEVTWEGYGAFEDRLESRTTALSFNKPLKATKDKTSKEDWNNVPPNITHYFVTVTRVRFADGSVWTAPASSEEDKKSKSGWHLLHYQGFLSRTF